MQFSQWKKFIERNKVCYGKCEPISDSVLQSIRRRQDPKKLNVYVTTGECEGAFKKAS